MWTIARFNWPFYVAASAVLFLAVFGFVWGTIPLLQWTCAAAVMGSLYFLGVSLGVSHQVYDRSDLYRWA